MLSGSMAFNLSLKVSNTLAISYFTMTQEVKPHILSQKLIKYIFDLIYPLLSPFYKKKNTWHYPFGDPCLLTSLKDSFCWKTPLLGLLPPTPHPRPPKEKHTFLSLIICTIFLWVSPPPTGLNAYKFDSHVYCYITGPTWKPVLC